LLLAAVAALASCESTKTLMPAMQSPQDLGLAVHFEAATEASAVPQLVLLENSSGAVLARAASQFTPEVVQAVGPPQGDRLIIQASLSGDTIAAWENASGSVPDEQIVVFKKDHHPDGSASWYARNLYPPSRDAKPYPIYAKPVTVDDESLYFTIENGPSEKVKWAALNAVPPGYKPKPVEVKKEEEAKEGEPKDEKLEKSEKVEEAKIEQAPM
jgi:hypothetical protein